MKSLEEKKNVKNHMLSYQKEQELLNIVALRDNL